MRERARQGVVVAIATTISLAGCAHSAGECDDTPGSRTLDVGRLTEGAFVPFHDGEVISVVNGFQGGMWVMPAVEMTGVVPGGHMAGSMALWEGALLGEDGHDVRLEAGAGGALLLRYIPIPVGSAPTSPPVAELDGRIAILTTSFVDDCGTVVEYHRTLQLKIEGGPPVMPPSVQQAQP